MTPLLAWEARFIRRLSELYVSSIRAYDNKTVGSPVDTKEPETPIKDKLKNALREIS